MDDYIKRLRQYVEANPILFDGEWDHPAMDSLYWHYSESHYMGNEKTKEMSRELNDRLEELILSRLVDTFISRISLTMLPVPNPHNTVCVLSWEEARHWQSRSSGYSSS